MGKALGVGGIFFKAKDKTKLGKWYEEHLGIPLESEWGGAVFKPSDMPNGGYTIWGPFDKETEYFNPSTNDYMINLVVDKMEEVIEQARAGGAEIVGDIVEEEYGKFGWFIDPEGNKIELWEPVEIPPA